MISVFFENVSSKHLSGFRKGHSCQSVLLNLVEKCKLAIDSSHVYGIILTDISKAFDCLPYKLVICKLRAYGLGPDSCKFIMSYFTNRKQRVKVGNCKSEWLSTEKGAPQGSVFGPYLFNLFQNDLVCLLERCCEVYNYADDNTIGAAGRNKCICR